MTWDVANYNVNPALNTAINGVDISELCAAAGFDDALRQIMADIATWIATQGIALPVSIVQGGSGQTTASAALAAFGGLGAVYQDLPYRTISAATTFADTDRGGAIEYNGSGGHTITVNPHATTPIGGASRIAVITVYNTGSGNVAVAPGTGAVSIFKNGQTSPSTVTLAPGGQCVFCKFGPSDGWRATGTNVS